MKCLLDIDGVILPYGGGETPNCYVAGQNIWLPDHMGSLIRQLDARLDIIWCTSWEEDANQIGRLLGLSDKPFLEMPRRIPEEGTYKLESVQAWGDHRFIWIDDEIGTDAGPEVSAPKHLSRIQSSESPRSRWRR